MFFKHVKKLLPKKLLDGAAPKTIVSQHMLSKLGVTRKQIKIFRISNLTKIAFGILFLLYFGGYQPTLAIPPIHQAIAQAEFTQQGTINSKYLSQPFQLPHPGYLTTHFSSWHPGIDIATGLGMPIHPIAKGKVVEITQGFWGLGHYTVVEHEQEFRSTYGHMGKVFVKVGDLVELSSTLGEVGLTGRTTGPHTHLEISKDGRYIDPQTILPPIANWPEFAGKPPAGKGDSQEKTQSELPTTKAKSPSIELEYNYLAEKPQTNKQDQSKLSHPLLSQEAWPSSQTVPFPD